MNLNLVDMKKGLFLGVISLFLFFSCDSPVKSKKIEIRKKNAKAEYILRHENTYFFPIFTPTAKERDLYPWEEGTTANLQKITKEFFRCRGSSLHLPVSDESDSDKSLVYKDCAGGLSHSLPIIHGKEGVYPVLIEILNYIQQKTEKKVIITCGHRCVLHNKYSDNSRSNNSSKHQIGAEVDFYVQTLEHHPMDVIDLIFKFYKEKKGYMGNDEYLKFERYSIEDSNVTTMPWYNKEIFIKLYKESEGRDFDNRHPYPYISIQVRYDRDTKKKVVYSLDKTVAGSLR